MSLSSADSYAGLFDRPTADFVFPLLNRGGFFNSEMLLPLLCNQHGLPYLGASPIVRGLSDDKHLTKLEAAARGVPTAPWALFRSEEHTSELQSLMRISYAVFCLKKKTKKNNTD